MKARFFLFCVLWLTNHVVLSQTINTNYLRRDETLQYDEIALKFSAVCRLTSQDKRTLGHGLDRIRFLDSGSNALLSIDIGTSQGSYYLGEGWYGSQHWSPDVTGCWANGLAAQSMIYCHIPQGTAYIEFTATTACNPITNEVRVNGQLSGTFGLPAYVGWRKCLVQLPQALYRHLDYTLLEGGPLQVGSIDWISAAGAVVSSLPTVCTLTGPGNTASFASTVPAGAGDFQLRLTVPPPVPSRLRVSVNTSSALILSIPAGSNWVSSAEPDALERQADKRTREAGWGEDFNARKSGFFWTWPNIRYTGLECDGDVVKMPYVEGESSVVLTLSLPEALPIADFPYLSVKLRASKGAFYFVRPVWYDDQNQYVALWFDDAPTDDRMGTGDWETLTVSLPRLVRMGGSPATMVSAIEFPLVKGSATNATLELDWVRIHKGFPPNPEDRTLIETNFSNHLDDDGDGLTDMDDIGDSQNVGFSDPLVLSHYHGYYGSRFDASADWLTWKMHKMDCSDPTRVPTVLDFVWDPDTYDPLWPGKRMISSPYYPLNYAAFPDYVPPANGRFDYATFGGLETYDCLNSNFVRKVLTTAKQYGIDGFVANSTASLWPYQDRIDLAAQCGLTMEPPFLLTALYSGYQGYLGDGNAIAKSDYSIAMDLMFFWVFSQASG